MNWNHDIEAAPRNTPLCLLLRDRDDSLRFGFGVIQKSSLADPEFESLQFAYVGGRLGSVPGVVSMHGPQVIDLEGWSPYLTDMEGGYAVTEADRRVMKLEAALLAIGERAALAAEYYDFEMLENALTGISEDAQAALEGVD